MKLQKYIFQKPTVNRLLYGLVIVSVIFAIMIITTTFLEADLFFTGLIIGGLLVGILFYLTRNILFPVGVLLVYNLTVLTTRSFTAQIPIEDYIQTAFIAIGEGCYVVFVTYWFAIFGQYIFAKIKNIEVKNEPLSNDKMLVASTLGGAIFGITLVIQAI